eukprot:scaffold365638_cov35-Attheya_sp.AAC.3
MHPLKEVVLDNFDVDHPTELRSTTIADFLDPEEARYKEPSADIEEATWTSRIMPKSVITFTDEDNNQRQIFNAHSPAPPLEQRANTKALGAPYAIYIQDDIFGEIARGIRYDEILRMHAFQQE